MFGLSFLPFYPKREVAISRQRYSQKRKVEFTSQKENFLTRVETLKEKGSKSDS